MVHLRNGFLTMLVVFSPEILRKFWHNKQLCRLFLYLSLLEFSKTELNLFICLSFTVGHSTK